MEKTFWSDYYIPDKSYGVPSINIIKKFNIKPNDYVLEIGAGYGRNSQIFSKLTEHLYLLDINSQYKERLSKYSQNIIITNGLNYPFQDNFFDVIYCELVIQHIYRKHIDDIFKELHRILKFNSIFCFDILNGIWETENDHFANYSKKYINNGYSKEKIQNKINDLFKIEKIKEEKIMSEPYIKNNAKKIWYFTRRK